MAVCAVVSCVAKSFCKSYCTKHYHQWRRGIVPMPGEIKWKVADDECVVDNCTDLIKAKNLCSRHYAQLLKGKTPGTVDRVFIDNRQCTIEKCKEIQYALQMCHFHWQRVRLKGLPGSVGAIRKRSGVGIYKEWDRPSIERVCRVTSCSDIPLASDLCERHRSLFKYYRRQAIKTFQNLTENDLALIQEYHEILLRDPCSYCGSVAGTIDHIHPISKFGSFRFDNLTAACRSCNSGKSNTDLLTYLLRKLIAEEVA